MNTKILMAPRSYIQGPGALGRIGNHLKPFGIKNPIVMASPSALKMVHDIIEDSLKASGIGNEFIEFRRECTFAEIDRIKKACLDGKHDAIVSCGGGKAMDAGRAAAAGFAITSNGSNVERVDPFGAKVHCVQVPTVAASDAATASSSVIYNEQGIQTSFVMTRKCPTMVLADTSIIAGAPVRTLVAGMGDAMATHFEAEICRQTGALSVAGGSATRTALMMAKLAFDIVTTQGKAAIEEMQEGTPGPNLEAVVEANILLSGLGYESCGLAAAHAIAGSLTIIHDRYAHVPYHGELVAFGTLTQLVMEDRPSDHLERFVAFCKDIGLPTTFDEMGLKEIGDAFLKTVADDASRSPMIRSMPKAKAMADADNRYYDPGAIFDCMKKADDFGRHI
ncbi:MAG: iron-containing alcohol dehydrogenase [Deltaproteobacteria bacterium]|nr:iron-containing alcohol dehydrogenase [Deltaproteobacteria bacterium]